jgi:hypothetical protein
MAGQDEKSKEKIKKDGVIKRVGDYADGIASNTLFASDPGVALFSWSVGLPFVLGAIAVTSLAVVGIAAYENSSEIKAGFQAAWKGLTSFYENPSEIKAGFQAAWKGLTSLMGKKSEQGSTKEAAPDSQKQSASLSNFKPQARVADIINRTWRLDDQTFNQRVKYGLNQSKEGERHSDLRGPKTAINPSGVKRVSVGAQHWSIGNQEGSRQEEAKTPNTNKPAKSSQMSVQPDPAKPKGP